MPLPKFGNLDVRDSFRSLLVDQITLEEPPVEGCISKSYVIRGYKVHVEKAPAKHKWMMHVDGEFFTDFLWR